MRIHRFPVARPGLDVQKRYANLARRGGFGSPALWNWWGTVHFSTSLVTKACSSRTPGSLLRDYPAENPPGHADRARVRRRQDGTDTLMPMPVAAIVLAAGASRRLGQPKQLLRLDGETLLPRVLRLAGEAGATPLFAVLGAHREIVAASIRNCGAQVVFNPQWEQGIASSICAGLGALDAGAAGALLLGCDQTRLTASHLRAMMEAFAAQPAPSIVASRYAGVLGIPALFPRSAFPELLALRGDKGARALLLQPSCPLLPIEFPGGEIDIDLPADLKDIQ